MCGVNESIVCMTIKLNIEPSERNASLYNAVANAIEKEIRAGRLKPGDRLPTHRDLADDLGINVSTVTRGYKEAESRGLVSGTVGRGTFVSSDALVDRSMVVDTHGKRLVELGLVTPLYTIEPDAASALQLIAKQDDLSRYLKYTEPEGLPEHRAAGAVWAGRYGIQATAETVLVCAGAQHALTIVFTALFQQGDRIAVDELTYPGLKSLTTRLGIRLSPVAMDEYGMIPEALDSCCRRDEISGIYLMPTVHNPTTICMPDSRRDRIAEIAQKHNLMLIEDDAYALTRDDVPKPISERMRDNAVSICGVSKAFAAGLRIAFVVAPAGFIRPLSRAILNTIWMAPTLNAALASRWILDGTADTILEAKKKAAAERYEMATEIFSDYSLYAPPNGYFIWLPLPDVWTGSLFEARCREADISLFCAEKFAVGAGAVAPAVRVSLTGVDSINDLRTALITVRSLMTESPDLMPVF